MKKLFTLLFITALTLGFSNDIFAQAGQESHGNALNIFASFGNTSSINVHYEFEITPDITLSPLANIRLGDNSGFGLGGRGDYYFDRLFALHESWDIYAGVDVTFNFDDNHGDDIGFNGHMGAEYMITQKFGIIGEFGFGNLSSGSIGLGIHF